MTIASKSHYCSRAGIKTDERLSCRDTGAGRDRSTRTCRRRCEIGIHTPRARSPPHFVPKSYDRGAVLHATAAMRRMLMRRYIGRSSTLSNISSGMLAAGHEARSRHMGGIVASPYLEVRRYRHYSGCERACPFDLCFLPCCRRADERRLASAALARAPLLLLRLAYLLGRLLIPEGHVELKLSAIIISLRCYAGRRSRRATTTLFAIRNGRTLPYRLPYFVTSIRAPMIAPRMMRLIR